MLKINKSIQSSRFELHLEKYNCATGNPTLFPFPFVPLGTSVKHNIYIYNKMICLLWMIFCPLLDVIISHHGLAAIGSQPKIEPRWDTPCCIDTRHNISCQTYHAYIYMYVKCRIYVNVMASKAYDSFLSFLTIAMTPLAPSPPLSRIHTAQIKHNIVYINLNIRCVFK